MTATLNRVEDGKHTCPGPSCLVKVTEDRLACRPHWYQVPKNLRDRVWSTYRRAPGSAEHYTAMAEAVATMRPLGGRSL
jgi:hypothetical protein